ncbi:MAG: phosphocholine cytidylyltransferase family protein [Candidatus Rokubacteria bacterium]|nr:phosphocholine cytidylyltransferase family protein [Candidatus Rokubacteria bacterium]
MILAAGAGRRLRPLTDDRPKALVPLGETPLIGHALDALLEAGIKHAIVVTGYRGDALARYLSSRFDFTIDVVQNPHYLTTNTLASFAAVAHLVEDEFLLVDGHVVFEPALVSRIMGPGTRVAVDLARPVHDDMTKVATDGDRVVAVGTRLRPGGATAGVSVGMAKIDVATGERLFVVARHLLDAGAGHLPYEAAFNVLIDEGDVFEVADVTGLRWLAVEDHTSLSRARMAFLPR